MRIKLLLLIFCSIIVLQGCSKKQGIEPSNITPIAFSLSSVLQSNMVIQRDKPFTIWGTAKAADKVAINVSWNQTTFYSSADPDGNWVLTIPATPVNSNPQTVTAAIEGEIPIVLTNILIGDVWICSGQSNMVMPVDAISPFIGVANYQQEIANANYPQIRAFTAGVNSRVNISSTLLSGSKWDVCSPATVGAISAVSYFFARKLNTELNIPIGIIIASVNNSICEQWMNSAAFQSDLTLPALYAINSGEYYNGMIAPLINLSVKGFIWYQGESNENEPAIYPKLNSALINGWRAVFKQGALPFYYVQVAPFDATGNNDATLDNVAVFREEQALIRGNVTNSGMAVTMDVGEIHNHHPQNKKPVGERLALLALKNDYNKNIIANGPTYASFTVNNNTATLSFINGTADGLTTIGNAPLNQYFFVEGTDQVLRQGYATISGSHIIVTAPADTPLPIQAIRYAFTDFPITNIQNSAGLPMEPFRTD